MFCFSRKTKYFTRKTNPTSSIKKSLNKSQQFWISSFSFSSKNLNYMNLKELELNNHLRKMYIVKLEQNEKQIAVSAFVRSWKQPRPYFQVKSKTTIRQRNFSHALFISRSKIFNTCGCIDGWPSFFSWNPLNAEQLIISISSWKAEKGVCQYKVIALKDYF